MSSIFQFGRKFISIESQMTTKKTVFLEEYKIPRKIACLKDNKIKGYENNEKINDYASLYINDFEIVKYKPNKEPKPIKCKFNSLPENNSNPFLIHSTNNDLRQKRVIDLRTINNTEELNFFILNESFSE